MTDLRTAAQQALEALKMMRDQYEEYACPACDHADAAIYALRAALAEPDYASANPLGGPAVVFDAIARRLRSGEPYDEVLDDYGLQHASAEPVQDHFPDVTKMVQEPVQEPVAWIQPDHLQKARVAPFLCRVEPTRRCTDFVPLWTSRSQRKPLTEEEIVDIWADVSIDYDDQINIIEMARAIERAYGIWG